MELRLDNERKQKLKKQEKGKPKILEKGFGEKKNAHVVNYNNFHVKPNIQIIHKHKEDQEKKDMKNLDDEITEMDMVQIESIGKHMKEALKDVDNSDMVGTILDGLARITEDTVKMASEIKNAKDSKTKSELVQSVLDGLTHIGLDTSKIAKELK